MKLVFSIILIFLSASISFSVSADNYYLKNQTQSTDSASQTKTQQTDTTQPVTTQQTALQSSESQQSATSSTTPTATNDEYYLESTEQQAPPTPDPLEKFNRKMFFINEQIDRFLLKPLALIYNRVLPTFLTTGLHNCFKNLDLTSTIFSDLLQANFYQMTSDTWRLLINSTVGLGGFFDVAADIGLTPYITDFGITLGKWGYSSSTFLVIPVLGPTSPRDLIGTGVNYLTALDLYLLSEPTLRNSWYAAEIIDQRAQLLQVSNLYENYAADRYIFIRDSYLQHRRYLIERSRELNNPYTIDEIPQIPNSIYLDE